MHGTKLSNDITVADFQAGDFISVFFILWVFTNRGELINDVVLAYGSRAFDDYMRANFCACINLHVRANIRKRPDFDIVSQFGI